MQDDSPWRVRGLRGATTVDRNEPDAIIAATRELLDEMVRRNDVRAEDVASAWFSTTRDLDAEFPAVAARRGLGWDHVALMCGHEMDVPGALPSCLRILLHINTPQSQEAVQHVYLRGATVLRPDVVSAETSNADANP
ncbi:MAG: chorismate mutase [Chloroflexi bacterium]|jgi:chorismate mutase|nr:MAG: chorismate mutase [Chloroflexota bacterium]